MSMTAIRAVDPRSPAHRAGVRVGEAVFTLNGKEIGRVDLLCGEHVVPRAASAMSTLRLPG